MARESICRASCPNNTSLQQRRREHKQLRTVKSFNHCKHKEYTPSQGNRPQPQNWTKATIFLYKHFMFPTHHAQLCPGQKLGFCVQNLNMCKEFNAELKQGGDFSQLRIKGTKFRLQVCSTIILNAILVIAITSLGQHIPLSLLAKTCSSVWSLGEGTSLKMRLSGPQ